MARMTTENPEWVDCKLFRALRMSPSAVKMRASKPPVRRTRPPPSADGLQSLNNRSSDSRVNRRMAHRDWIGLLFYWRCAS